MYMYLLYFNNFSFFPLATSFFATNNIMYIIYGFGRKLENIFFKVS